MVCSNCNHKLPEDSEFCQYCGKKIEKRSICDTDIDVAMTENALEAILKIQAQSTAKAMEANSQSQPNNENDFDFGLVPQKPIFTLAFQSVDGEEEYLNKLYTVKGEKIGYRRRGSMMVNGINGMVDVYDTFLLTGQPYKTIYINMYGAKQSVKAPVGFVLGTISRTRSFAKATVEKGLETHEIPVTNTGIFKMCACSLAFVIVAILAVVGCLNTKYKYSETEAYYFLSIAFCVLGGLLSIASLKKKKYWHITIPCGEISFLGAIIPLLFEAVWNDASWDKETRAFLVFSILCIAILIVSFLFASVKVVPKAFRSSIHYKIKSYKKIETLKKMNEQNLLSDEEFKRMKEEILSKIET